ncbi:hypothetical protein AAHE18_13G143600 [Arachis hypogaea]
MKEGRTNNSFHHRSRRIRGRPSRMTKISKTAEFPSAQGRHLCDREGRIRPRSEAIRRRQQSQEPRRGSRGQLCREGEIENVRWSGNGGEGKDGEGADAITKATAY